MQSVSCPEAEPQAPEPVAGPETTETAPQPPPEAPVEPEPPPEPKAPVTEPDVATVAAAAATAVVAAIATPLLAIIEALEPTIGKLAARVEQGHNLAETQAASLRSLGVVVAEHGAGVEKLAEAVARSSELGGKFDAVAARGIETTTQLDGLSTEISV
eukprot:1721043-Prymnesium_polylepis.1